VVMTASSRPSLGDVSEYALDHAPAELIQEFLLCLLRLQQAATDMDRYLGHEQFIDLKKKIDDYEPVDIRLSDGRLMRLGCTRLNCQSLLCLRLPKTRAECPTEKPCPHVRCRDHLWRVDACDRPGRPGLAQVPRDAHGLTVSTPGELGEERAGTTLEARWLETPVPPSCALDEVDRHKRPMGNIEVAAAQGRHRTLSGRIVNDALESAKRNAAAMFGMSEADLLRGLREIGAGK
jgi:hypothetical protein